MTTMLSAGWTFITYVGVVLWNSFLSVMIFLPFILVSMVLQQVTRNLSRQWAEILGCRSWFTLSAPGVVIHELSHAIFCLLFGHDIQEIKFFTIHDDCLGYVRHSYNSESLYQRIGNLFIGIAPIPVGIFVIIFLTRSLMNTEIALTLPADTGSFMETVKQIALSFKDMTIKLYSPEILFRWQTIVWVICLTLIGSHITLSAADLEGADSGLEALCEALVIYHFIMVAFYPIPKFLLKNCGNILLQSFYFMLLVMCLLILIWLTVYIIRCIVRFFKFRNGCREARFRAIFIGNAGENQNIEEQNRLMEAGSEATERGDKEAAFQYFREAAVKYGFPGAQYFLGLCYLYGYGTDVHIEEAERCITLAAEQGHQEARCTLGKEYFEGTHLEVNYKKALKWLKRCINDNDPEIFQMLGECYESALGVRANPKKAFQYYKQALDLDPEDEYTRLLMGECYCNGTGVKQDYDQAIRFLTPLQKDYDAAKIALGKCFLFGKNDAYGSALLFSRVTSEEFQEEADELLYQAENKMTEAEMERFLLEVDAESNSENDPEYSEPAAETDSSSGYENYTFSNLAANINIRIDSRKE